MTNSLTRFHDQLWGLPRGHQQYGGIPPHCEIRFEAVNYRVATVGLRALEQLGQSLADHDCTWVRADEPSQNRWKISQARKKQGLWQRIKGTFRMFRKTPAPHTLTLRVEEVKNAPSHPPRGAFQVTIKSDTLPEELKIAPAPIRGDPDDWEVSEVPFSDPFTTLAATGFQTWEKEFATRKDACPSLQFALEGSLLFLEKRKTNLNAAEQRYANRKVLRHYLLWIAKEFGKPLVRDLQYRYDIDFKRMFERGEPLTPEIVYRINVGVNNVERQHLKTLLDKFAALYADLQILGLKDESLESFLLWYYKGARPGAIIPRRELRGLWRTVCNRVGHSNPSSQDLANLLHEVLGSPPKTRVADLKMEHVDLLVNLIWPPQENWSRQFSGREITHKAIMGFYTLSDHKVFKPWLDQHELLQVLPACRNSTEWIPYLELVTHVVSKKHLVRRHPDERWRVGALIPGPRDSEGKPQWFVVTSCLDNYRGVFNYTLEPATKDSDLPFIKLYRSTASSPYAMNGWTSIIADLEPTSAPGGRKKWKGEKYEMPFIKERTIPVWVGYYLKARQLRERNLAFIASQQTTLRRCVLWQRVIQDYHRSVMELCEGRLRALRKPFELTDDNRARLQEILEEREIAVQFWTTCLEFYREHQKNLPKVPRSVSPNLTHLLNDLEYTFRKLSNEYEVCLRHIAQADKELPEHKKGQDVYFAGHSLGGGQAQGGLFHFGPFRERIPVPGHRFVCYATNSVAIKGRENDEFLRFGEEHKELLVALGQRWKIIHTMEYADMIPLGGDCPLGASLQPPHTYQSWLDFGAVLFTPKKDSTHLEVYDPPTHGKRYGRATENLDYDLEIITSKALRTFNETVWLSREDRKKWGLPLLASPRTAEWLRKGVGWASTPYNVWFKKVWEWFEPPRGHEIRDSNKYFFCSLDGEGNMRVED